MGGLDLVLVHLSSNGLLLITVRNRRSDTKYILHPKSLRVLLSPTMRCSRLIGFWITLRCRLSLIMRQFTTFVKNSLTLIDLVMLISKVISSMTASLRFDGELNVDLGEFRTNLVPFPRLHFMTTALAPVISKKKASHEAQTVREITDHSFQPQNMLVKYAEFDPVEDKYMAISINYRGDIKSKEANATVQWLKQNNKISFVEWCPTGFKIG